MTCRIFRSGHLGLHFGRADPVDPVEKFLCSRSDWQLSSLVQVCISSFPWALIPAVEYLVVYCGALLLRWKDDIESSRWLELYVYLPL